MNFPIADIPILTYHKIDDRREWGITTVRPRTFREQIRFLAENGYHPVNFQQVADGVIPGKPVIITFDDGYESVYRHALPVLQEFGFTAVVFLITGYLGRLNHWDANLGGHLFRHLDRRQIAEMAGAGIEIASHGMTHRAFTLLENNVMRRELADSRALLQDLCGQPVNSLAYPFGLKNRQIITAVRESGYRFGCVNLWGGRPNDAFRLQRIPVYRTDSMTAFRRKLGSGGYWRLEKTKLLALSWPARLTPLYQQIFQPKGAAFAEEVIEQNIFD